jgi:hypothetical protein
LGTCVDAAVKHNVQSLWVHSEGCYWALQFRLRYTTCAHWADRMSITVGPANCIGSTGTLLGPVCCVSCMFAASWVLVECYVLTC